MNTVETAKDAVTHLLNSGADKAQCHISKSEKHELNVAIDNISLFRTTFDTAVDLLGLVGNDGKKGTVAINKTDTESIGKAVWEVIQLAGSSKADPANDISGTQLSKSFSSGPAHGDLDNMYVRLKEFLAYSKAAYPNTLIEEINFDFTRTESVFVNSNEVEFRSNNGAYNFDAVFTSKDGVKTSSMNYVECRFKDLNLPIKDIGGIDRLFNQSAHQLQVGSVPGKFNGPIIITPECLSDFIVFFTGYLSNFAMIAGNSVYQDKLGQKIADCGLTLRSNPIGPEPAPAYFYTDDGFEAKNTTIIANGILNSFLLDLYAANKTGRPKADNMGGYYVIDAGDSSLNEMIQSTPRGLLLCRFSGGNPGNNGDFSGVAKNSYYIENGKIRYPIKETMVSGNIVAMLENIDQISKERNNDGYNLLPWIKFNNITISGK